MDPLFCGFLISYTESCNLIGWEDGHIKMGKKLYYHSASSWNAHLKAKSISNQYTPSKDIAFLKKILQFNCLKRWGRLKW